jgi:chemotaxis protein methyltransferase CheR
MTTVTPTIDGPTLAYVQKLLHDYAGIELEPNKQYLVQSRLGPLAREAGFPSLHELVRHLRGRPAGTLHARVVEAMATNETSFFRDIHPFEALKNDLLPPIIAARQAMRTLTFWSAACSTGQEPYSIAILLAEHFPQLAKWTIHIHATDLSQQSVERAIRGEYTDFEVSRGLSQPLIDRYFDRRRELCKVKPELRRRIKFAQANLIGPWPQLSAIDVMLLRNVLIYMAPEAKREILGRTKQRLAADGALLLGGAETTIGIDDDWQRVSHGKCSSYRLKGSGEKRP